jgi:glycosyltransferase involved in cell wall biosynthesis
MHLVSVIVPCYNEQATIGLLLDALYNQTYPRQDMEVIIADGLSTDGTRQEIEAYQLAHPQLKIVIVDNQQRIIPAGLNQAIRASSGEFIVRLDAHSVPNPDYIERCVTALQANLGENVGGVWEIKPAGEGWMAKAIAEAASHPLGVGDAYYRYTGSAKSVDTVPFGAFRRSLIDQIGLFDETLLTNEDYEFNVRVRQANKQIWLDPAIRSIYFARPTWGALLRQYWRYGYWKGRMLRRYPHTIRWRQALPPLFVISLISLFLAGFWAPIAHIVLLIELCVYFGVLFIVAATLAIKNSDLTLMIGIPLAIGSMHIAWGAALLLSLIKSPKPGIRLVGPDGYTNRKI